MHEHALMRDLVRQIHALAEAKGATRVVGVRVRLGALSHFTPEHFREHFEDAARGGPAEGAAIACEASQDLADPSAQSVVLESVELETPVA
jgi:hydrogenase nickel incorporation protein HypA/HybF